MDLTHSFTVPTSVDDAWALFMDLEKVGSCFPGATVTEVRDDGFSGTVKVKLGPIAMIYSGSGAFVERDDAAHTAVISAKGKDKRGNGTAGATVTLSLSPDGEGSRADVVTDLAVTGKPAQFGRGVMQDVSDKLLQTFVACVEKQLGGTGEQQQGAATPDREPVVASADAPAPAGADSAASTASVASTASTASTVKTGPETDFVETASDSLAADTTRAGRASRPANGAGVWTVPPPRLGAASGDDDAIDLGSAVLPVLVRRYAGFAAAAAIGGLLGWVVGRRR